MKGERTAIIGVGLLGGSLALALRRRKGVKLVGWNHRASSRRKAAKLMTVVATLSQALEGARNVALCAHSGSIGPFLRGILPHLSRGTLVMDVSSVKGEIVREASQVPGAKGCFVPCHPMAGKEKSGPSHADPDLYRGRIVFLTPLKGSPRDLVQRASRFWRSVGAVPIVLPAATHDRLVALTSHLPHLLSSTLMNLYSSKARTQPLLARAVGTGFRDMTRIAGGSPSMWTDIMRMNSREVLSVLSLYRRTLWALERELRKGRSGRWKAFFERARTGRETLR